MSQVSGLYPYSSYYIKSFSRAQDSWNINLKYKKELLWYMGKNSLWKYVHMLLFFHMVQNWLQFVKSCSQGKYVFVNLRLDTR